MKCKIQITGGISGNRIIEMKLHNSIETKKIRFNGIDCFYDTVGQAKKDIAYAYEMLKTEEPEFEIITKMYDNTGVSYDASTAKIINL